MEITTGISGLTSSVRAKTMQKLEFLEQTGINDRDDSVSSDLDQFLQHGKW